MWSQDRAYTDLMREMWGSPSRWNERKTYTDVARKLGVDEETVRNRLRHLKESGYLLGWRVVPNPALFGREPKLMLLEFPDQDSKEEGIRRTGPMDGVIIIANLYGGSIILTLFDDGGGVSSKLVAESNPEARMTALPSMRFPESGFKMTVTDWQIVGMMLRDAERRVADVASNARVSTRTIKRRLDQMMDSSAIYVMPLVDQTKSGGIAYHLMVEGEQGTTSDLAPLVSSKIGGPIFAAAHSGNGMIFGFFGRNVAQGTELLKWLKSQRGVVSAKLSIVEEVRYTFDWLERETRRLAAPDSVL